MNSGAGPAGGRSGRRVQRQRVGGSGTNTLELAAGTGAIGGVNTGTFSNFGSIVIDSGANWSLSGTDTAPTVVDDDTLAVAGSLDQLDASASMDVAAALATKPQISFAASGSSELLIDNAGSFGINVGSTAYAGPLLENFGAGDSLDLKNVAAAGASLNFNTTTGLLQIANGTTAEATLSFQASSLGSGSFQIASDGGAGASLTHV